MYTAEMPRIVSVNGDPGAGKTTLCEMIADRLDYNMVTTGMFYCATAAALSSQQISFEDVGNPGVVDKINFDLSLPGKPEVSFDGVDITDTVFDIRNKSNASRISSNGVLVSQIRSLVRSTTASGNWVIDRGSAIFPDADLKFWVQASPQVRATRRCGQLALRGEFKSYDEILKDILQREALDRENKQLLRGDPEEIVIDNSFLSAEQTYSKVVNLILK